MNGYITLDYELGMGSYTGTPDKCLVEPMRHLTAMTEKYGVKMNVFADAAYLLQLKQLKDNYPQLKNNFVTVTNHLRQLDAEGHAIQLHLHPQWCYSTFDGERWNLDVDHYKLSDMPLNEQKRLIEEGTEMLNSIITKKVTAFRAGGYSIENFPELYDTFLSVGINVDSSVYRGNMAKGKYNVYDYRNVPSKTSWKFLKNHKVENDNGDMMEYPISTIVVQAVKYLINKMAAHPELNDISSSRSVWGDGKTLGASGSKTYKLIRKLEMLMGMKAIRASIEQSEDLEKVYDYSSKHYQGDDFVIIGHPKAISQFNIEVLERFIGNHPEIEFKLFT